MDDHEAIRQLVARYNRTFDERDVEGWVACFTEDATFEYAGAGTTLRGHDELRATILGTTNTGRHTTSDLEIAIDGDEATMSVHLTELGTDDGRPVVRAYGRYVDRLVRVDDGWRFRSRRLTYG